MYLQNCLKKLASALFMSFIVSNGGPLYATGGDALFIDQNGNVGIGTQSPTAALDVKGNVNVSGKVKSIGSTPVGGIIMFCNGAALGDKNKFDERGSGMKGTEYEGWQLCNGQNGAPDLRDRFVVSVGAKYKTGDVGGADSVTLTVAQMPTHDHNNNLTFCYSNAGHDGNDYRVLVSQAGQFKDFGLRISQTGGIQAHENRPPYYALAFLMRIQ